MVKKIHSIQKENDSNFAFSKLKFHKLYWYEYLTIALFFWFIIYPRPYEILFSILLAIPIIGLLINKGLNGKPSISTLGEITYDNDYDVAAFINLPGLAITIRVLLDFHFLSYNSLLIPGLIAFLILLIILFTTHKLIKKAAINKAWIYTSILTNLLVYSYAGILGSNCVYDFSEPKVYHTKVLGKRISNGKRTSYYLTVLAWGNQNENPEISVSKSKYDNTQNDHIIYINQKKGLLNIPWYYVE